MKISLITITYNSVATLEQTLQSVIAQTYPNVEYIVVDGGSSDGTLELVQKYRTHIHQFISEADNGLYDALNKGISMATGEVIGILHSDDFYTEATVLEHVAFALKQSQADGLYANLYYVDRQDTNRIVRQWNSGLYKPGAFLKGWMPPHPTFFVRKQCYQQYGNFNLSFKSAADYELMLRFIHQHGIQLCYLPEYIIKMRVGGLSNVTLKNRLRANTEDRNAWRINGLKPRFYTLWLKPLRKLFQFF